MGLRVFNLKQEATYGTSNTDFDFTQQVTSGNAKLGDEPILRQSGSRMNKYARPGAMKPVAEVNGDVDLKRIGHYYKAFLDNYTFTDGGADQNTHEFWGQEGTELTSFTGEMTFDSFKKTLVGMLLDELNFEISDEFMSFESSWIYKTETAADITPSEYTQKYLDGDIPVAFYDVALKVDGADAPGVVREFKQEMKNNLNQDSSIGLGARGPQVKAIAQAREIELSFNTTLTSGTLDLILAAEYGKANATAPQNCSLYELPLQFDISFCEDLIADNMTILFPKCVFSVEYEASESDEIEAEFKLQTLGTGQATKVDGTKVVTDIYVKLENDMPEINSTAYGTSTVSLTFSGGSATEVTLTNTISGTEYEASISSNAATVSSVPFGKYTISLDEGTPTPKTIYVNKATESRTITVA